MTDTLRRAREQLTAALSRCHYPTPDQQYAAEHALSLLRVAEHTGKSFAAAIAAASVALAELEARR